MSDAPSRNSPSSPGFFHRLGGTPDGPFKTWLENFKGRTPRILWYPSCGTDYRDLLFAPSGEVTQTPDHYGTLNLPAAARPELYIHTDFLPSSDGSGTPFNNPDTLHQDGITKIRIEAREELASLRLPVDTRLVDFEAHPEHDNRWFFFKLTVESALLGSYPAHLLFGVVENTAFAERVLLAEEVPVPFVVVKKYGSGFGGSRISPSWIPHLFQKFGTRYLLGGDCRSDETDPLPPPTFPRINNALRTTANPRLNEIGQMPNWGAFGPGAVFQVDLQDEAN